jgi:hypothetical protein
MPMVLVKLRLTVLEKVGRSFLFLGQWAGYFHNDRKDGSYGIVDRGISRHTTKVRQNPGVGMEAGYW